MYSLSDNDIGQGGARDLGEGFKLLHTCSTMSNLTTLRYVGFELSVAEQHEH